MPTLLIVDDDITQRLALRHFLSESLGADAEDVASGEAALARLADTLRTPPDLVVLDYYMAGMDGAQTLRRIRILRPDLPVIMLTGSDELDDAVMLMREGASDYITKPFNPARLRMSVEQHLTLRTLRGEVTRLRRREEGRGRFSDIIGAKETMAECIALARKAALSEIPVLICGESGTGKELMARAIHGESARSARPFIAVNCGAIPGNLVESTLFGHEKGSFTGAISREPGKFRAAEGGTLFLDEVGELTPDMQTRLLRVLQEREIEPVGAGKAVKVDVRILSATHRNLAQDVAKGRFREDLYYRLNVLPLLLPPLRHRPRDIPAITRHTLARFCASEARHPVTVTAAGMRWLMARHWAGNVRELENLLYRAVVISDKRELDDSDFAAMAGSEPQHREMPHGKDMLALLDASGKPRDWESIETEVIAWALDRCSGEVNKAARLLGMGQSTIYKKIAAQSTPPGRKLAGPL